MLTRTSNVNAQEIKQLGPNKFEIDSTAVKEFASLIVKDAANQNLKQTYENQIHEKDTSITYFKKREVKFVENEGLNKLSLETWAKKEKDTKDKHDKEINELKWVVTKTKIGAGIVIALTIFGVIVFN